ncbi:cyclase family protein [Grimontia sp. NTOU-MAR1]|uniref:cyclase family protein n=1 Tax=Grimontia sp. NTOU-MAR1 TaxID=3111011 RepID=UPI002DB72528|nr:cyclase family protein [Grimontia sp. NTOU-MAR1]WRW00037.1 cyclase family protein [Grimontia sp. NTOU-MAR1]
MMKYVVAFLCLVSTAISNAAEPISPFSASEAIDLTHPMHNDMPFWPGGVPFKKEALVTHENGGYLLHKFSMGENTGTHVDAPIHFIKNRSTIEDIPLSSLIVPVVVIDARKQVMGNPDYQLSVEDLKQWESEHGTIPKKSLFVMNTGWHTRFNSPEQYINMDKNNVMHFPGYSPEAAAMLVDRGVTGIGIDTLSLDHGPSQSFATHIVMLKAGKYQIENMANLTALPPKGATVIIGVLPIQGGSQAQARILALLP